MLFSIHLVATAVTGSHPYHRGLDVTVDCPGADDYCDCRGDCTDRAQYCSCAAALACCSAQLVPQPSPDPFQPFPQASPMPSPQPSPSPGFTLPGIVVCPGLGADDYCDCTGDCTNNPSFCACSEAQACCSAGPAPSPSYGGYTPCASPACELAIPALPTTTLREHCGLCCDVAHCIQHWPAPAECTTLMQSAIYAPCVTAACSSFLPSRCCEAPCPSSPPASPLPSRPPPSMPSPPVPPPAPPAPPAPPPAPPLMPGWYRAAAGYFLLGEGRCAHPVIEAAECEQAASVLGFPGMQASTFSSGGPT